MSCSKIEAITSNVDLLTEILIRLPLKSIIKFKCVCKRWQALISSHGFSRCLYPDTHLVSGLIIHRSSLFMNTGYEFVPLKNQLTSAPNRLLTFVNLPPEGLKILQSCNGLIFCSRSGPFRNLPCDYYIYNPTSQQFATLPPPGASASIVIHRIGLAYDPAKSTHFKIVCILSDSSKGTLEDGISYHIEVYSSQTGFWRLSGDPFVLPYNLLHDVGVYWNGAIHWVDHYRDCYYFKVDEELLQEMPMPATQVPAEWTGREVAKGIGRNFVYFGESREHLHIIVTNDEGRKKFDVYEMERDYSGWFIKYRVDPNAILATFRAMGASLDIYTVLGIIREANDEDSYVVLQIPGKAIRYKLNDNTFSKLCDFDGHEDTQAPHLKFELFHAYHYMENLTRFG